MAEPKGALIDQFRTVVRFNDYKLKPVKYTGRKTSVWAVNQGLFWGGVKQRSNKPNRVIVCSTWSSTKYGEIWLRLSKIAKKKGYEMVDRGIAKQATEFTGEDRWLSIGALIAGHFLRVVPSIAIIGFDHFHGTKLHYGDNKPFDSVRRNHSSNLEEKWFDKLSENGHILRL